MNWEGFDAVFEYEGQTYAEMNVAEKASATFLICDWSVRASNVLQNLVSDRYRAQRN